MARVNEIAPGNSNNELKDILKSRFSDLFGQTLLLLEVAFPHQKGDGSDNEKRFSLIRSKILRIGNNNIRDLDGLFEDFAVFKINEYVKMPVKVESDIFDFRKRYSILQGGENGK